MERGRKPQMVRKVDQLKHNFAIIDKI